MAVTVFKVKIIFVCLSVLLFCNLQFLFAGARSRFRPKHGSEALYLERRGFLEFFLMNILDNFKRLLFLMFLVSNVLCKPWSLDLCLSVSHLKCRYTKKISLSLFIYLVISLSLLFQYNMEVRLRRIPDRVINLTVITHSIYATGIYCMIKKFDFPSTY